MIARSWPAALLLALGCGGDPEQQPAWTYHSAPGGSGGQAAGTGGAEPQGGAQAGGSAGAGVSAGTGGATQPAGGTGGAPEPQAGSGGSPSGGTAGSAQGGVGGGSSGGTGGTEPDPLAPVPAENCPGYWDLLVPLNTCIWFHGDPPRTFQNAACDVIDPIPSSGCGTVTATQADLTSRVSVGANYERFPIDSMSGLCPQLCN